MANEPVKKTGRTSDKPRKASYEALFKVLSKHLKKKSLILKGEHVDLRSDITQLFPQAEARSMKDFQTNPKKKFQSVIFFEALENVSEEKGLEVAQNAWASVKYGGRLFIVSPNEDAYTHPHQVRQMKRKDLKRLLCSFGSPKATMEQPYKWLVTSVKKRDPNLPISERILGSRFAVTTGLCRGSVLELGCGRGYLSKAIRDSGHEVIGVDISKEKIAFAQKNYPEIRFQASDILKLNLPGATFDTVLLPEILEHVSVEVGDRILEIAWSFLKPSGRLIVSVPNENCIPHPNHIREFTRKSLERLLSRFGAPKLVTEQPFKWLLLYVEKKSTSVIVNGHAACSAKK